jgi:hypothetical protein
MTGLLNLRVNLQLLAQQVMGGQGDAPDSQSPIEEKLLFLQGNMVSFISQYQMPIIEVSLVVSKYLKILTRSILRNAKENEELIPEKLTQSAQLEEPSIQPLISEFPIDALISSTDEDRMDIFDTIIRTSINRTELPFVNSIALLRDWEGMIRKQLSRASSPGHLFSPLEIPEGF